MMIEVEVCLILATNVSDINKTEAGTLKRQTLYPWGGLPF
jgi:hypothetical protein